MIYFHLLYFLHPGSCRFDTQLRQNKPRTGERTGIFDNSTLRQVRTASRDFFVLSSPSSLSFPFQQHAVTGWLSACLNTGGFVKRSNEISPILSWHLGCHCLAYGSWEGCVFIILFIHMWYGNQCGAPILCQKCKHATYFWGNVPGQ